MYSNLITSTYWWARPRIIIRSSEPPGAKSECPDSTPGADNVESSGFFNFNFNRSPETGPESTGCQGRSCTRPDSWRSSGKGVRRWNHHCPHTVSRTQCLTANTVTAKTLTLTQPTDSKKKRLFINPFQFTSFPACPRRREHQRASSCRTIDCRRPQHFPPRQQLPFEPSISVRQTPISSWAISFKRQLPRATATSIRYRGLYRPTGGCPNVSPTTPNRHHSTHDSASSRSSHP